MAKVPLTRTTWRRDYAGGVQLQLLNRFFEEDPSSTIDDTALIARPGTDSYRAFGSGTMRGNFTQQGFFGGDLFVASGQTLYRWDGTTETAITGVLSAEDTPVSITYQASPGVERLWIADGATLYYYEGDTKSRGNLDADEALNVSPGDVVLIDTVYYEFVASGVDAGTPAGTLADPWLVLIGATSEFSLSNLSAAIGNTGTPGGTYSTALLANPNVEVRRLEQYRLNVQAVVPGAGGDTIVTTTTAANLTWGAATLENGGLDILTPVDVPDGGTEAAVSLTTLAAYVIVSVAGSQRMYFIRPGEFWIEVFAEAESEPDVVLQVVTVGSSFWALGESTIEPWTATGDADIPFAPIQGRQMSYGIVAGTALVLEDRVIYVDDKGIVRDSSGARISTHGIEEEIRLRT